MKPYDCDYTWEEVKAATNRCIIIMGNLTDIKDPVKRLFDNNLPGAMRHVATRYFICGLMDWDIDDIKLIRDAFIQIDKVGYIGKQ